MSYTSTIVGLGGTLNERSTSLFALTTALNAATRTGAKTELLDLRSLELPMYVPGKPVEAYGENVGKLVATLKGADGLLISTAAYQGTLAGVTKNALDFLEFLRPDGYLGGKPVGLIATSGGDMDAANAANALVHAVHALRGTVVPPVVTLPRAWQGIQPEESRIDPKWQKRLERLGRSVLELARSRSRADELTLT